MSFLKGQFANVVEWEEFRDDMIFGNGPIEKLKRK